MPRDLPLGNGRLLVNFDDRYMLRDFYFPHVGKENHSVGHPFRFGVWCDGRLSWISDDSWERDLRYQPDTLVTQVTLTNRDIGLRLHCQDAVDFHEDVYLRHIDVENLTDKEREIRLFFSHDFHILESANGDTAYYRPWERLLIHYKDDRYFSINACTERGCGLDQYATGIKEAGGAEGTWRDAEDGVLGMNPIAQGSVDSTIGIHLLLPPQGRSEMYYWITAGTSYRDVQQLNDIANQKAPAELIRRTANYWRLWVNKENEEYGEVSEDLVNLYKRSLLTMRTHINGSGAVIAATDSDIIQFGHDTYTYMWPRDGALAAYALNLAGFLHPSADFFAFCRKIITKEGFFLHKYNGDGTLGSSWHPWVLPDVDAYPIQEDETALVLWSLARHFHRFRDIESIKPLYRPLIIRAANWICDYRDAKTGLPHPSYDLWEERFGIHAWTLGAIYGGLQGAADIARAFGEIDLAEKFETCAREIRVAADRLLWQEPQNRFVRSLYRDKDGILQPDMTLDASLVGLYRFGMYDPHDPRIVATLQAAHDRLWVKTGVGGMARYENDYYHQVSQDIDAVPGNPWFICAAWLAQWHIATAEDKEGLTPARELLEWIAARALPSGILAEQMNPYTDCPLSVSPLTWSHAEYIIAFLQYVDKGSSFDICPNCSQPQHPRKQRLTEQ